MNNLTSLLPPQNIDAERGVLGSNLLFGESFEEVRNLVAADDFYVNPHKLVFKAVTQLYERRLPIDAITVSDELTRCGWSEEIGGDAYLMQLLESVPHAAHAAYYAGIVREKSRLRALIYAAGEIMRNAYESPLDADTILRAADSTIVELIGGSHGNEPVSAIDGIAAFQSSLEQRQAGGTRLATGFTDLDFWLKGGFPTGTLTILGAGTSIGKSAIAGNFAAHVGREHHTLILSLEMSTAEYYARLATAVSRTPLADMEQAVETGQTSELSEHLNRIANLQISIDDHSRQLSDILSRIRCSVRKHGTKLVIADYLQLITPSDRRAARHEQIGQISGAFKDIAMELDIAVVALSQLSRAANEDGIKPQLHHLRESGSLEMDADIVLLLSRRRDDTAAVLDVAKHRGGSTGSVNLTWRPNICRFDSALQSWQSPENFDPFNDP